MFILDKNYQWDGSNPYNVTYRCVKITKSFVWFDVYKNDKEYIKVNDKLNLYA